MVKKTIIINLIGGPGSGKSTLAASVYAELKKLGHNVELVTEYIKDWAYQGKEPNWYEELYVFAKQLKREADLYGKVDFIVTDSPLELGAYYEKGSNLVYNSLPLLTSELKARNVEHKYFYLNTVNYDNYSTVGRFQVMSEALQIHEDLRLFFNEVLINEKIHILEENTAEEVINKLFDVKYFN